MRRATIPIAVALSVMAISPSVAHAQTTPPAQGAAMTQEQRQALLQMRQQLMALTRAVNEMIAALGPLATVRERPAMVACPWPMPSAGRDTLATPPQTSPAGVVDPPRPRIPDCYPPAWKPPAQLQPHTPAPLPADRPKSLVDDYLKYVVTAPESLSRVSERMRLRAS